MHLRAHGPLAPDAVWARYVRFDRWPTWSPQIRRVEVAVDELAPGVRGIVRGPLGLAVDFTVEEVDERARTWSWTVSPVGPVPLPRQLPTVRLHLHHAVVAGQDGGSLTTLDVTGPTPVVMAYAPVALIALRRLVGG